MFEYFSQLRCRKMQRCNLESCTTKPLRLPLSPVRFSFRAFQRKILLPRGEENANLLGVTLFVGSYGAIGIGYLDGLLIA